MNDPDLSFHAPRGEAFADAEVKVSYVLVADPLLGTVRWPVNAAGVKAPYPNCRDAETCCKRGCTRDPSCFN